MRNIRMTIWCLLFFSPVFVFILYPAVYVMLADPLWQWDHPFHLERWHRPFNERTQKTNYLSSHEIDIDTLIVGSSRSSYINPTWLGSDKGFNYAVSSGKPSEFASHIDYVRKCSCTGLNFILIESSFGHALETENTFEQPRSYIGNAEDWMKKFKSLFSRSAYKLARNASRTPSYNYYFMGHREISSYRYPHINLDDEQKQRVISSQVKTYREQVYNMPYDNEFSYYIGDVHRAAQETDFVVYTTPVTRHLMKLLCDLGRLDDYERWLRELVGEFGAVLHFMYPNHVSMDDASFNDAHHPTEATSEKIVNVIMNYRRTGKIEGSVGVVLTKENIDKYVQIFRKQFQKL